jgi:hypothetical protein
MGPRPVSRGQEQQGGAEGGRRVAGCWTKSEPAGRQRSSTRHDATATAPENYAVDKASKTSVDRGGLNRSAVSTRAGPRLENRNLSTDDLDERPQHRASLTTMAPQKQSRKEAHATGLSAIGDRHLSDHPGGMDAAVVHAGTCPMHGSKFTEDVRASENALPKCTVQTGWHRGAQRQR